MRVVGLWCGGRLRRSRKDEVRGGGKGKGRVRNCMWEGTGSGVLEFGSWENVIPGKLTMEL
jgi:hypothetical protein